jgi:transcriptional regulator with XRE-family HTH domain
MAKSSITKLLRAEAGSPAACEVGRRVRAHRIAAGLTQSELAMPLSKGFVSAVENGLALPSLGTLWLFAARLGTRVGDLVDGVNGVETPEYTATDEGAGRTAAAGDRDPASSPDRR